MGDERRALPEELSQALDDLPAYLVVEYLFARAGMTLGEQHVGLNASGGRFRGASVSHSGMGRDAFEVLMQIEGGSAHPLPIDTVDQAVSAETRLALAQAGLTEGQEDDLAALRSSESEVASKLAAETEIENQIALTNELALLRNKIRTIENATKT